MTSQNVTPLLPLAADPGALAPRKSASDWAYVLAFGFIGWPWLLRSLSGGSRKARAALLDRLELEHHVLPHLGSWKADTGYLTIIADHILAHRPAIVVEFGAGASSLIAARALQINGAGTLTSFDQHIGFAAATQAWLGDNALAAEIRAAPLKAAPLGWPGQWYDHAPVAGDIDLLLVDGPPWALHPYVRGAAESLFDQIAVGGVVMLDDGARPGERVVARRWRKRWPNFEFALVNRGTKGTLIGRRLA